MARTSIKTYIELSRGEYQQLRVLALRRGVTLAQLLAELAKAELRKEARRPEARANSVAESRS